jgi:hypothetical protein
MMGQQGPPGVAQGARRPARQESRIADPHASAIRIRKGFTHLLLGVAGIISAVALAGNIDFYQQRLQAGIEAFRAKRLQEAVDELRIAAFGMLEQPTVLLDTLARLALAQQAVGRTADAELTLNRFIEVERKFNSWGKSRLEPELKTQFEALLAKKISPETLLAISSLADLVEKRGDHDSSPDASQNRTR